MSERNRHFNNIPFRFFVILILFFSILIIGIFYAFSRYNHQLFQHEYLHKAQALFQDIVLTRRWNANYGGVYVEKKEGVESNPFLEHPEITGSDGTIYSLRNPAYMTREISELAKKAGTFEYKITSLQLINPINMYDQFEKNALLKFEEGETEVYTEILSNGTNLFRYMAPLYIEASCLSCHGYQNYEIGDVRGGISVTFQVNDSKHSVSHITLLLIIGAIVFIVLVTLMIYFIYHRMNVQLLQAFDELKKSNNKLESERKQFLIILESMPLMVYVMDLHNQDILFINKAYRDKLGKDPTGEKCYHALQGKSTICAFCKIGDQKLLHERQVKYDRQNEYLGMQCMIIDQIIQWTDGRDVKIQFALDITARKKAEQELNEQKAYMDSLFDSLQEAVILADNEGKIHKVNPAFADLFWFTPNEILNKHISEVLAPTRLTEQSRNIWNKVSQGETVYMETQRLRKDGFWLDVSLLGAPIVSGDEQIGIYGIFRDITEQIRNTSEMQNLMEELKVSNDELQMTLEKLMKTQKLMVTQEKLASLGMLTAGIAHEIKNPLNFINNFAEIVQDTVQEVEVYIKESNLPNNVSNFLNAYLRDIKENNRYIRKHGASANSIIQNMLLHSRNTKGNHERVNLHGLIGEYLNLTYHGIRAQNPAFHVEIVTHFDPIIKSKLIIPQSFSRVLLNIFTNAFQAMLDKFTSTESNYKPEINVYTHQLQRSFEVRIRDNGPGINKENQEHIFEPFFTTKAPGMGTGLGLSISYDIIVNEHGGRLMMNSEEGIYTEFVIVIPDHREEH